MENRGIVALGCKLVDCKVIQRTHVLKLRQRFWVHKIWKKKSPDCRHWHLVQVILFEIDCTIFYINLQELICQFISWTNLVNSGTFMDNCWISCQVTADMKKVYDNPMIINPYIAKSKQVRDFLKFLLPALKTSTLAKVRIISG